MYAIVESRSRQYRVSPGDVVALDLFSAKSGDSYTFDKVLMLVDDENQVILDRERLNKVKVTGTVKDMKKEKLLKEYKSRIKNMKNL